MAFSGAAAHCACCYRTSFTQTPEFFLLFLGNVWSLQLTCFLSTVWPLVLWQASLSSIPILTITAHHCSGQLTTVTQVSIIIESEYPHNFNMERSIFNGRPSLPPLQTSSLAARAKPTMDMVKSAVGVTHAEIEPSDESSITAVKSPCASTLDQASLSATSLGHPLERVQAHQSLQSDRNSTVSSDESLRHSSQNHDSPASQPSFEGKKFFSHFSI